MVARPGSGSIVTFGLEQFKRVFLREAVNGEPAKRMRALEAMEDA